MDRDGLGRDGSQHGVGIDPASSVDGDDGDRPGSVGVGAHRRVLDRAHHVVRRRCAARRPAFGGAVDRGGDGFGGAAGEDHLAAAGPEPIRDLFAGHFERMAGGQAFLVDAPGVATEGLERVHQGGAGFGPQR